jgi:hypothetical protein
VTDIGPTWRTRAGRELAVADMDTAHIERALAMLKRKGCIGPRTLRPYLHLNPDQMGEFAYEAAIEEFDALLKRPVSPFVDIFEQELRARHAPPLRVKDACA